MAERPLGVTIICFLAILFSIFELFPLFTIVGTESFISPRSEALGLIVTILGILGFVPIYWLWKMTKRGWRWTMVIQVTNIFIWIYYFTLSATDPVLVLIPPAIILIYLWMKKDLFK